MQKVDFTLGGQAKPWGNHRAIQSIAQTTEQHVAYVADAWALLDAGPQISGTS
jgi:hypothetical protein